ncbi:cytochrome P450 [Cercophora scortea]|uniref:Cytochrome P450 n=1 Tax=Cercophora scortea TaxID=314031 RepID=A0AAE0J053_9PEZI|nr:cytochrome P450 [Cercophora scortea]
MAFQWVINTAAPSLSAWFPSSWYTAVGLVPAVAVLWYILSSVVAWYRLRHFPGPFFASFSYLWFARLTWRGNVHRDIVVEQEKYGPVMRSGPNQLLVHDPDTLWHINSMRSGYGRSVWYTAFRFDQSDHNVFTTTDTKLHDRRKAQLHSAYIGKGAIDLEKDVDSQLAVLVNHIRTKYLVRPIPGKASYAPLLDLSPLIRNLAIDFITLAGLGKAWGNVPTETDHYVFLQMIDENVKLIHTFGVLPWVRKIISSDLFLKYAAPKPTDPKGIGRYLGVVKEEAGKRFKDGIPRAELGDAEFLHDGRGNMLDEWIKNGLPQRDAELELLIMLSAGSETTAVTIRGTLLCLMSSPPAYQRLKKEIVEGIKEGRISKPITNDEAKKIPYLQAIINEGMRMFPPLTVGFGKQVPPQGDTIHGKFVPGGAEIHVNLPSLMRNKQVFGDDIEVFRPERFLEGTKEEITRRFKTVELNFGHGRWQCLGKTLATIELNKVYVELFRAFDFQIVKLENPTHTTGYTSVLFDELIVRVVEASID